MNGLITSVSRLAVWAGLALGALTATAGDEFFQPVPDRGANLPADRVYPEGRMLTYAGFSPFSVDDTKANKFTVTGPAYGKDIPGVLAAAAKAKMPVLYPLDVIYKGKVLTKEDLAANDIDWQAIAADLTRQVKAAAADKSIAWWYLTPEELRWWIPNEIKYLELAYKTIKAADPAKRPVWMYSPGHRNDTALSKEAPFQDIIGKGTYTNYSGQKNSRIWVRWSMEQEKNAIKLSRNPSAVPILVPEMFEEPKPEETAQIPAWVRHDVYLGMVSGAKGVVIFSLWPRNKFPSHPIYYKAYCQVARELNGDLGLGQVFLFGEPKNDVALKITEGPQTVSCKFKVKTVETFTYPTVALANLAYGSDRYLIAVNSANQPVSAVLSGLPKQGVTGVELFTRKALEPADGQLKLSFGPYQVIAIKLSAKN